MNKESIFSDIILPVSIEGTFTYIVPKEMEKNACVGMRVLVPFGKNKLYAGIIYKLHQKTPEAFEPKSIAFTLDDEPIVSELQLQFWDWIAGYYMCTLGEVMSAALPAGLKLSSETIFYFSPEKKETIDLSPAEQDFYAYFYDMAPVSLNEIRKSQYGSGGIRMARKLAEEGFLMIEQRVKKSYKPRKEICIRFSEKYQEENVLTELFDTLGRAPAQQKALEKLLTLSGIDTGYEIKDVGRSELISGGVTANAIQSLIRKGVLESYEVIKSRIHALSKPENNQHTTKLTSAQNEALEKLTESFKNRPVALLQGVTSSGKTEIYIRLIREEIAKGKQVLYLLPEIAITTQMIQRLKNVFGNSVGVYHSKYSDNERVEVYRNMTGITPQQPYSVLIGVRSAIFLPFNDLGLVIVDEEHEHTYKQFDPAPRYHARDASIILALYANAKILLGSATPSIESLHNVKTGKYGFALITERYGNVSMPEIVIADVARARKRKQLKSHFTPELIKGLEETFNAGKQAILFQNRRGYSNYFLCHTCGYILKCNSCDVSLTYHKSNNEMSCHYCGFKTHV
ncbi:MAG TPA: primosomal protein N', partial [Bacteroidales bacterium]|nr:primosomal protein N' [Bacteroidales bacterium]